MRNLGFLFFALFLILSSSPVPEQNSVRGFAFFIPVAQAQSSVLDLNDAIQARKQERRTLQSKIEQYQTQIRTTQRKAASLINQITVIDSNIAKTRLEIENKELEAQQLALEAELVARQIELEEARLEEAFEAVRHLLRELNRFEERRYVEVVLARDSFSEIFDQLFYSDRLFRGIKSRIETAKLIKNLLEDNYRLLEEKHQDAQQTREQLGILKGSYESERRIKEALFGQTKATEAEFQDLLAQLRAAASAIDADIVTLERRIRERLDIADRLKGETGVLSWPVSPLGGISAGFHDPEYPFRYLFEHGGIDIRAPQGTPVRAAASGYVAKTYNSGFGIAPTYVLLVHGNELSTVYMHLSQINVAADTFVARGDVIGLSGGAPKTSGAGRWSTGPHVHFETRINGVPVDPMGYLP